MRHLGVFAKYWQPGKVKTRLAAAIGELGASKIHRSFVATLLQRFHNVADQRTLAFTPIEREGEFLCLGATNWQLRPQSEGDLGVRMKRFFADQLSNPANRVVLIGSDSPTLPVNLVEQAFRELEHSSVVIGPATDGGYYLIGLTREVPDLFSNIEWGSSSVWQQTIDRLVNRNTPFVELPPWYDVDKLDDLRRLDRELRVLVSRDSQWSELAEQVRHVLTCVG